MAVGMTSTRLTQKVGLSSLRGNYVPSSANLGSQTKVLIAVAVGTTLITNSLPTFDGVLTSASHVPNSRRPQKSLVFFISPHLPFNFARINTSQQISLNYDLFTAPKHAGASSTVTFVSESGGRLLAGKPQNLIMQELVLPCKTRESKEEMTGH
ncbi:hypothetical protein Cgig2_016194 [Carnegiea gigantea]|uniref:Uncharacterized protein n=1 Tax=Carnegiea gigantea TaxID=171969 RepID=A0A9Q1KNP5_9CARY|nr:hypothetical protein Cgig2_016194 [Carnegiea gigantea]